jgi:hypothetical protein
MLSVAGQSPRRFAQNDTVFARLPAGPDTGALLGYYHPYCRILSSLGSCQSYYLGNAGRWFDGLLFFSNSAAALLRWIPGAVTRAPDQLLQLIDPMYRISTGMAHAWPELMSQNDKALVLVHYNIPHYPAAFAERALGLSPNGDDHVAYSQNLLMVDRIIGQMMEQARRVRGATSGPELLLIVTSDHWHRINSLMQARRIPFLAWHVGETAPVEISERISTVHTGELVLDFLAGKVTTQEQIARWWQDEPVHPVWIPSDQKY